MHTASALGASEIAQHGAALHAALRSRNVVEPLTVAHPDLSIADAYRVADELLRLRLAEGERVIGRKIGVTSRPVQAMLDVDQPDFGTITDAMVIASGATVDLASALIQPRAEAEIAFVLGEDLLGPGITVARMLQSLDFAVACIEIVDSRIRDWKIRIGDTIADNASCGMVVLGTRRLQLSRFDPRLTGCAFEKNGSLVSTGAGAAVLGSPINSLVWLANTLGHLGVGLRAGELLLSGSLVPLEPVRAGDAVHAEFEHLGSVGVRFA